MRTVCVDHSSSRVRGTCSTLEMCIGPASTSGAWRAWAVAQYWGNVLVLHFLNTTLYSLFEAALTGISAAAGRGTA